MIGNTTISTTAHGLRSLADTLLLTNRQLLQKSLWTNSPQLWPSFLIKEDVAEDVAEEFSDEHLALTFGRRNDRRCIGGLLVCGIAAWGGGIQAKSLGDPTDTYTADTLIRTTLDASIFSNILLVNTPQVPISFVYLFYNNAVTGMLLARNYASTRKPLRTTRPVGQQRTTYWLQMPYRYVLPLMAGMALLHWLVSSIFLVQIETYDASESSKDTLVDTINACDYSIIFAIPALVLGFALIVSLGYLSYRKLDPGMPVAGPCSLAISAACANVTKFLGFSGQDVEPLEWRKEYL
ncbi:unnamed protein product [Zymoseptoria tritici ST99CH_3D7]|uniref:Uncharacterized protein n=1 Tax=Zymoseptoria tritici (strain ST99CH_3D7) TaxID=1276538 RepID=A0A1X7RXH7_ZYMT9|nr:unnamed protein product [Zymoseptoria tritici ST99CH_3D7]